LDLKSNNMLFKKKITIPKDNAQSVTVLESWTVEWSSKAYNGYGSDIRHNAKVFISEANKDKFVKQLKEASKFINAPIDITTKKN